MIVAMNVVAICLALVLGLAVGATRDDESTCISDSRQKAQKIAALIPARKEKPMQAGASPISADDVLLKE